MESRDLYQDDLTEERQPTPAQRDDVARTQVLDPQTDDDAGGTRGVIEDTGFAEDELDDGEDDEQVDDDEDVVDDDEDEMSGA
jgi:hypothetical protein